MNASQLASELAKHRKGIKEEPSVQKGDAARANLVKARQAKADKRAKVKLTQ